MSDEEIFIAAIELTPEARASYLDQACGNDDARRARIETLLGSHDEAGTFLANSAELQFGDLPPLSTDEKHSIHEWVAEQAGDVIGPYTLCEPIGEGGFGSVWMAEQHDPISRQVALKVIKAGMDTKEVLARFEQERQALAMMDHPNIAKVLDAGATDLGRPYFAMELVKGIPITRYCDEAGLDTRSRLALFAEVCSAINHAHQKGVIHRDIKPSNVLVTLREEQPMAKVIDFGVAKAMEGRIANQTVVTRAEQFIGTPAYMSPEQASLGATDVDTRTDIYALGILLYELLVGRTPFDGKSLLSLGYDEMRRIILEVDPEKPSSRISTIEGDERDEIAEARQTEPSNLNRLVEPDLDWIVMKAIDKDRALRYESASAFAQDISNFLANEPVSATPPSAAYQFRKFARRHKSELAVASVIATVLIAASLFSTWQAVRAKRAEQRAIETLAQVAAERDGKEQALQEAEAITRFVSGVLLSPNPRTGGRNVTVASSLDQAVNRLDEDTTLSPRLRARMQTVLGRTYWSLGLYSQSADLMEKALEFHLANTGTDHPITIGAMHRAAKHFFDVGRKDEALKLREQVLSLRTRVLGAEHIDTFVAMNHLATTYHDAGRFDEALRLREKVAAHFRNVVGHEDPGTWFAVLNLAYSYEADGQVAKALALRKETLAARQQLLGPEHPETLVAMADVALSYHNTNRLQEALDLRILILELRQKVLGPRHPRTLMTMKNLAATHQKMGHIDEAKLMREERARLTN